MSNIKCSEGFQKNVRLLVSAFEEMINPFTQDSRDIITFHLKRIMLSDVVESV